MKYLITLVNFCPKHTSYMKFCVGEDKLMVGVQVICDCNKKIFPLSYADPQPGARRGNQ